MLLTQSKRIPGFVKDRYTKIGKMSINDVINNIDWMTFGAKIDYIRHNYTYYNGNEDLFYEKDKKTPNYRKKWLNKLIAAVILKKYTPDVLKNFNNIILKWKKENEKKQQALVRQEMINSKWISNIAFNKWLYSSCISYLDTLPLDSESHLFNQMVNRIAILKCYLLSAANKFTTPEELYKIKPKKLFNIAEEWYNICKPILLEADIRSVRHCCLHYINEKISNKTIKLSEKEEEKYAKQKMQEYDQYLKSKKAKEEKINESTC